MVLIPVAVLGHDGCLVPARSQAPTDDAGDQGSGLAGPGSGLENQWPLELCLGQAAAFAVVLAGRPEG